MFHRIHYLLVAGAAAQVAADRLADLRLIRVRVVRYQRMAGNQHAARAVAALQGVLFTKRVLYFGELPALRCQAFHGGDLHAVSLHGKHAAGAHRVAAQQHRASPAHAVLAAHMGAGQPQVVAQKVHQRSAWLDIACLRYAVNSNLNGQFFNHFILSPLACNL